MGMPTDFLDANEEATLLKFEQSELSQFWAQFYNIKFTSLAKWAKSLQGYKMIGYWDDFDRSDAKLDVAILELAAKGKMQSESKHNARVYFKVNDRYVHLFCWEFANGKVIQAERVVEYLEDEASTESYYLKIAKTFETWKKMERSWNLKWVARLSFGK